VRCVCTAMAALHTRRDAPEHRAALTAQEVLHVPVQLVAIVGRVGTLRKAPLARSELLRGNRGPCTSASSRKPDASPHAALEKAWVGVMPRAS
jgi:hypothetical protein